MAVKTAEEAMEQIRSILDDKSLPKGEYEELLELIHEELEQR